MAAQTIATREQTAELRLVLEELAPALSRMSDGFADLRQALGGKAEDVLDRAAHQEEAAAHVAYLEHRRQRLQRELESVLCVQGLGPIIDLAATEDAQDPRLAQVIEEIGHQLVRLREEQSRTVSLLRSAIDVTQRARTHLLTQIGAEPSYSRPLVRSAATVGSAAPMETAASL